MMSRKIVEISRSKYGYGFTLSGEMPCRLTQVKSYANSVGLLSGDRLHSVNGENVENLSHDEVVERITSAPNGRLLLHVSSDHGWFCSTSTDDDDDDEEDEENVDSTSNTVAENGRCRHRRYESSDDSGPTTPTSSSPVNESVYSSHQQLKCRHRPRVAGRAQVSAIQHAHTHHRHSHHSTSGHHSGSHRHVRFSHSQSKHSRSRHQNILRPSQTYEQRNCVKSKTSNTSQSQSKFHHRRSQHTRLQQSHKELSESSRSCISKALLANVDAAHSNLHSDSEMHTHFGSSRHSRKDNAANIGTRFKSIDNLVLPAHSDDDDELLLHQHYRNRFKCAQKSKHAQPDNACSAAHRDAGSSGRLATSQENVSCQANHRLMDLVESKLRTKMKQPKSMPITVQSTQTDGSAVNSRSCRSNKRPTSMVIDGQVHSTNDATRAPLATSSAKLSASCTQVSVQVDVHRTDDSDALYDRVTPQQCSKHEDATGHSLSRDSASYAKQKCATVGGNSHGLEHHHHQQQSKLTVASAYRKGKPFAKTNSTTSGISSTSPSSSNSSSPSSTATRGSEPKRHLYISEKGSQAERRDINTNVVQVSPTKCKNKTSRSKHHLSTRNASMEQSTRLTKADRLIVPNGVDGSLDSGSNSHQLSDCHSQAIFRSVALCLGVTAHHHLESASEQQWTPDSRTVSAIIRHQLGTVVNVAPNPISEQQSSQPEQADLSTLTGSIPTLIASYADKLCLLSAKQYSSQHIDMNIQCENIVQCALLQDDKRYFVLLARDEDKPGRVLSFAFLVDRSLSLSHWNHQEIAHRLNMSCTVDPITNNCLEFPENAEQILRVVFSLYRKQLNNSQSGTGVAGHKSTVNQHHHPNQHRPPPPLPPTTSQECTVPLSQSMHQDQVDMGVKSMTLQSTVSSRHSATDSGMHTEHSSSSRPAPTKTKRRVPPPPPAPASSLSASLLPPSLLSTDPNEDSSPSCCATTSCDSFSFQQFQQHLLLRQQQQLPGRQQQQQLPTQSSRHMRPPAPDPAVSRNAKFETFDDGYGDKSNTASSRQAAASDTGTTSVLQQCSRNQLAVLHMSHASVHSRDYHAFGNQANQTLYSCTDPAPILLDSSPPKPALSVLSQLHSFTGDQLARNASTVNENTHQQTTSTCLSAVGSTSKPASQATPPNCDLFSVISQNKSDTNNSDQCQSSSISQYMSVVNHPSGDQSACIRSPTSTQVVNNFYNQRTPTVDNLAKLLSPSYLLSSHNDLSFNSKQLEAQFSPTNVRQATQRYLTSCLTNSFHANRPKSTVETNLCDISFRDHRNRQVTVSQSEMDPSNCDIVKDLAVLSVSDSNASQSMAVTDVDKNDYQSAQVPTSQDDDLSSGVNIRSINDFDTEISSQDAQPPTQSEETSDETESATSASVKVSSSNTATNTSEAVNILKSDEQSKLVFSGVHDEYCWMESPPEFPISERPVDVGWVGGWASDFDILLSDPVGIKAFTDFLRKEFSYENLQFFLTVQEFKKLTNTDEIQQKANEIYNNFISPTATEPVNVDSKARKSVEVGLQAELSTRVFALAEKQIYNLMKFDSYQRFLKSEIYKECALLELKGKPLPYETTSDESNNCDNPVDTGPSGNAAATAANGTKPVTKSKRRSIIPWARIKSSINNKAASLSSMPSSHKETSFKKPMMMRKITNSITKIRSKSLDDHITNHIKHPDTHSNSVDKAVLNQKSLNLGDSRNSLVPNSSDSIDLSDSNNVFSPSPDNKEMSRVASLSNESNESNTSPVNTATNVITSSFNHNCNRDNCHFLRIVFPDRSQTVVPSSPNETIDSLLRRLIEKRALNYLAYDVFVTGNDKPLDLNTNTNSLGCTELRVEQRVLFQLDLPNQDIVGVKARPTKLCSEVFRPLLLRYGYRPEHIVLTVADSKTPLSGTVPISTVDGQRIVVTYRDDLEEWGWDTTRSNIPAALNSTLSSNKSSAAHSEQPKNADTKDNSLAGQSTMQSPTSTKTVAYHNITQVVDSPNVISKQTADQRDQGIVDRSGRAIQNDSMDGDDTQSDAFFREIIQSAQYVPSPMQSVPASFIPSKISSPPQSTLSVAYGIVQSGNTTHQMSSPSLSQSYHHLSQAVNSDVQQFSPLRRFNSTHDQYLAGGASATTEISKRMNQIDLDESFRSLHSNSSYSPYSRSSYKASHLRDLQNHRNFQSHHCSPNGTVASGYSVHQNNATQYPVDLNTTADEMMLANNNRHQQPSMTTALALSAVPPPPRPMIASNFISSSSAHHPAPTTNQSVDIADIQKSPEKPPLRRNQSEPPPPAPPLPPKSAIISVGSQRVSMPPPPRPPPMSSSVSSNIKPYLYNHNQSEIDATMVTPANTGTQSTDASYV